MSQVQDRAKEGGKRPFLLRGGRFLLVLLGTAIPFLLDSIFLLFTGGTYLPAQLSIVYLVSLLLEAALLLYAILTRKRRKWWDFLVPSLFLLMCLVLSAYSLVQSYASDLGLRPFPVEGGTAAGRDLRETIVTSGFYIRTYVLAPMENSAGDPEHPLILVLKDTETSFNLPQVGYFVSAAGTLLFLLLGALDSRGILSKRKRQGEEIREEA